MTERRNTGWFIALLVAGFLVYWANTWGLSVYVLDEARNAGCAMEMHQRGDWVVPTFNGELRTDKPPMHYYFMRVAYELFGVNPFAARFFSGLMGLLTVCAIYFFVKKLSGHAIAWLSAFIFLCSIQLIIQFHLAVPDPYLIFFFTVGMLAFCYAFLKPSPRYYYLSYASFALAVLTKGPVAIAFAGTVVLLFLISRGQLKWRTLMEIRLIPGGLVFLALVLPWYTAVGIATDGEWLYQFFFKHNVGRFTATMEGHKGFPLASLVIVVVALLPFSFFLPQTVKWLWHERRQFPLAMFSLITAVVVVVFFALSRTILPNYPEPAVPFVAIVLGHFFHHIIISGRRLKSTLVSAGIYLLVAALLPVAAYLGLEQDAVLSDLKRLYPWFLILPVGAGLAFFLFVKTRIKAAIITYGAASICFVLVFFYVIYPQADSRNPVTQSVVRMGDHVPVAYYRDFNPAFVFALEHPLLSISSGDDVWTFAADHDTVNVITQKRFLPEINPAGEAKVLFEGRDLFERHTTVVLQFVRE